MGRELPVIRGRGASENPPNRFERLRVVDDFEHVEGDEEFMAGLQSVPTEYLVDTSKTIIANNDSPDVGFSHSVNPYRGCSHGCAYCYARPGHEYLGFSAGLDFETKIMVKANAPALLRAELMAPKYQPVALSFSGVTDCYQPAERQFRLTRQCLEVLAEFGNPASVITKNHLVTRDIDVLVRLASQSATVVILSVTTLDVELSRRMEPRTSVPRRRLDAIRALSEAGVPVGVMVAPVVPGLTDHEVPAILRAASEAGARFAGYVPLRLPYGVSDIFSAWLEQNYPDRRDKVLNRVRSLRGGQLNDPHFASRMRGEGVWADQLKTIFEMGRKSAGIVDSFPELSVAGFRRPGDQMTLW